MRINYIIDVEKSVTMTINARPYTIFPSHQHYDTIVEMLEGPEEDLDPDELLELIDAKIVIEQYAGTHITIEGGEVFYAGEHVHNALVDRILAFREEGLQVEPMIRFLHNLMQNPSFNSRKQLYTFLERYRMPITPDGHFMAYKAVREDYKDFHTGTIDHVIGQAIVMDRAKVDDDPNVSCSSGLHCCSWDYLRNSYSSGRILLMKVNPRDVVSVPHDYSSQKIRVCQYTPVEEVDRAVAAEYFGESNIYDPDHDPDGDEYFYP